MALHVAATLAGVAKIRHAFEGYFSSEARYLVKFDDFLTGSNASFCEIVVIFYLRHDDSVWQVQHCGCLRFIFSPKGSTS